MVRLAAALCNFDSVQIISGDRRPDTKPAGQQAETLSRHDIQVQLDRLRKQLVARYAAGATVKQLAVEFDIHHRSVKKRLEEAGVAIRSRAKFHDSDLAEAARLYQSGLTTHQVGAYFGVNYNTIARQLRKHGIQLRPNGRPRKTGS